MQTLMENCLHTETAGVIVTSAFAVEKEINTQIEALTVEQLNIEEFIEGLKAQMEAAYAQVPAEDEVVDNTDEPVIE